MSNLEGVRDVFVHHSGLKVGTSQFRYLVEGEYVEMCVEEKDSKLTGVNVTGIRGGKLMCETRAEGGGVKEEEKKRYKPKTEL